MTTDKRRSPRHELGFKMVFDDGDSYNAASVVNISETGMLLQSPRPIPLGAVVRLEPTGVVDDALFDLEAMVVRCAPLDREDGFETYHGLLGIGAEFMNLSEEARVAIGRMIEELEVIRAKSRAARHDPLLDPPRLA